MVQGSQEQAKVTLAERKRGAGAKLVYETLRNEILDLSFRPGSPIDEVQLAKRFGMSRTPIREALVRLAGDGLVDTLPNRSTLVANIDAMGLPAFYDAFTLMYRMTTRLAAQHHQPDDLERIRVLQEDYAKAATSRNALDMLSVNRDFHAAIAEAGRNPYFTTLTLRLLDEGRRILRLYYQSFDDRLPQEYIEEHEAIISAIAAHDVALCDDLARAHADQIVHQIQQIFSRDQRQNITL